MRICFIAHLNDLSGANRSLVDLVLALKRLDNEVIVICPRKGELSNKLKSLEIDHKIIFSGAWVGDKNREKKIKKIFKIIVNIFAELRYYWFFKNNKMGIQIIHFNSFIYGCGARSLNKLKLPYIWHIREFPEETFNLSFYNKKKSYDLICKSESVIAISKAIYNRFSSDFGEKTTLVYNGINHHEDTVRYHQDSTACHNILIVGAIAKDKGQFEAVKSINNIVRCNEYPNIKLNIVGGIIDNDYYSEMNDYIVSNNLNDHIIFWGYNTDLSEFRRNNRIVLICSKFEAFGRVTVEAMLAKQLVIGANTGGTIEIIDNFKTGILYEQGNENDLAEKIIYALKNESEVERIIENGYEDAISKFTIERTADEINELYKKILMI